MAIQVRQANAWRDVAGTGRLMYVRVGGQWMPVLDAWERDQGAWHKITGYSAPALAAPTNLRMNPADANNHSSVNVAWDWTQPANGIPVGDFHIVLTDEGGSWLREMWPSAGTRSWTFTNVTPNKRYRVYIAARYAGGGRGDTAFVGPLNWFVGQDSYVVNDVPIYGWSATQEYIPPYYYNFTSAANGDNATWGFGKAIDNNFSSYWNTDLVDPNIDANQGEGWMVQPPGDNAQLVGVRYWFIYPHTLWVGVYIGGGWQGGLVPYSGKYSGWVHPYVNANYGGPYASGDISVGPYDCRGQTAFVAGLQQVAYYDGYNYRMEAIEVRLLVQRWIQTGWGPRTVAAVNSGYY